MMSSSPQSGRDPLEEQASTWVAKRDRGLTPTEQDEYLLWLARDPRHMEEVLRQAAAFHRMMMLSEWQPVTSAEPNPALFARRPQPKWRAVLTVAAAVAIVGALGWMTRGNWSGSVPPSTYLVVNERLSLPDGSVVELKEGSHAIVDFRPAERRIRLTGEALFFVAKNVQRPFIVEAAGVAVRAVGTAFNVRVGANDVDVLVTEGSVRVHPRATSAMAAAAEVPVEASTLVAARHRVIVDPSATMSPAARQVTTAEIAAELAWKAPRFQFAETPLETAVEEFNRRNGQKIVLGDPALRRIPIGGAFRADNVEAFVRAVEVTLDLRAENRGTEIILTRPR